MYLYVPEAPDIVAPVVPKRLKCRRANCGVPKDRAVAPDLGPAITDIVVSAFVSFVLLTTLLGTALTIVFI